MTEPSALYVASEALGDALLTHINAVTALRLRHLAPLMQTGDDEALLRRHADELDGGAS